MVLKDEWVSAAMADDRVVVELLVRLKQSQASSSMKSPLPAVIPPRWGLRQRRSRIVSPFRYDAIAQKNKESTSTRCSPTTPLSWSGDTSLSATADGFEESSHPTDFSHSSRSKGCGSNECSCSTAMAKRLKRRKALADLRVEGSLLLKERVHLKKIESYYGPPRPPPSFDLRTYSASYAQSQIAGKELNLKKGKCTSGSSSKSWRFADPEFQRKKRVASYKMYSVEGKVKGSFRKSFRWLKDKYTQMLYGWW